MKILFRTAALAALAAVTLTGCDSPSAKADARPAARVGAAGSGGELPVTFDLATAWKSKKVVVEQSDPLAGLAKRGLFTMACEIDAKPAGNLGFLRVWTGGPAELKPSLTAFLGADAQQPAFTEIQVGGRPAIEVDYQVKSELDDSLDPEKAFVVDTGKGLVAVTLDSLDADEHQEMLPAYELARTTLEVL